MILLLERRPATDRAMLGTLFVDGVLECFTLENTDFAIPRGNYPVTITHSVRFGVSLPLVNVRGRSGIRIHAGNQPEESTGCVLVGQDHAVASVGHSRLALQSLQAKIAGTLARGNACTLIVTDAPTPRAAA